MIVATTAMIESHNITEYNGLVAGAVVMGGNVVRDIFASISDVISGFSGVYKSKRADAREAAMSELKEKARALGANDFVGFDLDYEVVGQPM